MLELRAGAVARRAAGISLLAGTEDEALLILVLVSGYPVGSALVESPGMIFSLEDEVGGGDVGRGGRWGEGQRDWLVEGVVIVPSELEQV